MSPALPLDPIYRPADVARFLREPPSTVRAWLGRKGILPVVVPDGGAACTLSITNVLELQVLSALRRVHAVPMPRVRKALDYVEQQLGVRRPLAVEAFRTNGADLFVERYGGFVNASKAGQFAMRELIENVLERVERDASGMPIRLWLFADRPSSVEESRTVLIDARRCFGRPVAAPIFVLTALLADRFDAGDTIEAIAKDFDCEPRAIREAIAWEGVRRVA